MKNSLYLQRKCPRGEIGRHAILRGWCRKVCWFESSRGHIFLKVIPQKRLVKNYKLIKTIM